MGNIKIDLDLTKRVLSLNEALELLAPHKEGRKLRVHTFVNVGLGLFGCDMDLTYLKKELKAALKGEDNVDSVQIAGINMNRTGHGIAYWTEKVGWTFLATDKTKLDEIIEKRKLNLEK